MPASEWPTQIVIRQFESPVGKFKMLYKTTLCLITLLAALALASCGLAATPTSGRLKVVVTYSILADIVENIGGDQIEVRTLVGPNGDAHTFQPSPADSAALSDAALIFENGLGFEPWLDDLYAASGSTATRAVVTTNLARHELTTAEHFGTTAELETKEFDPHVWHSVPNVMQMTNYIRDALIAADAANAETYKQNAANYLAQLQALETWTVAEINKLPIEKRKLVTTHDTFGYFAAQYGFDIVGTALASASTESAEPSAEEVASLIEQIKAVGVPALFAENISNPKLMEQISNETDVALAPPLYTDALGEPGSAGDTYLNMMRYNVSTIVTALNQ